MKPFTRYADRGNMVIRQWRILVLLRRGPRTLAELAQEVGCSLRTVRRDLHALQAVPFPVVSKYASGEGDPPHRGQLEPNLWSLGAMPEWPRNDESPVREVRA